MLRSLGFGHAELRRDHGVVFAVRRCSIDFVAPARLDDLLTVETAPERLGGARVVALQTALLGERPLARLKVELAVLGADDLRPRRLPAEIASRLAQGG
jgi:acyl-CoA thioester hydrolase